MARGGEKVEFVPGREVPPEGEEDTQTHVEEPHKGMKPEGQEGGEGEVLTDFRQFPDWVAV